MKNLRLSTKIMLVIMLLFVCSWCFGFTYVDKNTGRVKECGLKCPKPPPPLEPPPPEHPPGGEPGSPPAPPEDPHPPKD
jgi:hypothetical protein